MNRRKFLGIAATPAIAALTHRGNEAVAEVAVHTEEEQMQNIVSAAADFLKSLDDDQRSKALFPFAAQRFAIPAEFKGGLGGNMVFVGEQYGQSMWSNFPVSDVPRQGLRKGDLNAVQYDAVTDLLKALLSAKGYQKILDIMGSDQALSEAGTNFASGAACYTIGVFGQPSHSTPWMVQFGGHHLGLNLIIAKGHVVMSPVLTGAQPAIYTSKHGQVRVLSNENDKAFALLKELDADQREQAILSDQPRNLMLGPGHDGEVPSPEGLRASAMNRWQRSMLLDLIAEWAGIVTKACAAPRMAEIELGLDDTYFAWYGPITYQPGRNGASYFKIQGPRLVIEFAPQEIGGDLTMHVHTIYRDPTNDYARALLS